MNRERTQPQMTRSTLVTVLAWIFIVVAGFATFFALLQSIMINAVLSLEPMRSMMNQAKFEQNVPAFAAFMFENARLLIAALPILSASTLITAIALLKRKNWARLLFIGILALGIVWNIGGLVLQQFMFASMPSVLQKNYSPEFRASLEAMGTMITVIKVFSAVMAVGFSALFAWLIKRLTSATIRREFEIENVFGSSS